VETEGVTRIVYRNDTNKPVYTSVTVDSDIKT